MTSEQPQSLPSSKCRKDVLVDDFRYIGIVELGFSFRLAFSPFSILIEISLVPGKKLHNYLVLILVMHILTQKKF